MRYWIDEFTYDGTEIYVKGWAIPEHRDDEMKVYLKDESGKNLPIQVTYVPRIDVGQIILHEEHNESPYGFSFTDPSNGREDFLIYFDAVKFDIDYASRFLHVKEAEKTGKNKKRR